MAGRSEPTAAEVNNFGNLHSSNNLFAGNQFSTGTGNNIFNLSALHTTPTPSPSIYVPFRRDPNFIERNALTQVLERCTSGARVALVGLGGTGKSQIAIEACYRIHEQRPETWVFWVHASSADRFKDGYGDIAARMNIPGGSDPGSNILSIVRRWLSDQRKGAWLMVVDNADDEELMLGSTATSKDDEEWHGLKDYLPISNSGTILLTSRMKQIAAGLQVDDEDVVELGPMTEGEALTLFKRRLGTPVAMDQDVAQLARQLDYMPLALSQAAAYIKQRAPLVTIADYVRKTQVDPEEELRLLTFAIRDPRRDGTATNAILLTWHVSFRHIHQYHNPTSVLLGLMSMFNRERIPKDILRNTYAEIDICKSHRLEDGIAILRSFDLIAFTEDSESFRMHRLVQISTRYWLQTHGMVDLAIHAILQTLNSSFPGGGSSHGGTLPEVWQSCRQLLPHIEEVTGLASQAEYVGESGDVFYRAAVFYATIGRYDKAVEVAQGIWEAFVQERGQYAKATLEKAAVLGRWLCDRGRYLEAEHKLGEVYTQGAVSSCQHERWYWVATAHYGRALAANRKNKEATRVLGPILKIAEQSVGEEDEAVVEIMESFARIYVNQRQYERAILQYDKVVKIHGTIHGPNDQRTLTRYTKLGLALLEAGRLVEAESVLRDTNQRQIKIVGDVHLNVAFSTKVLARVLEKQGQHDESIKLYDRAATLYTAIFGPASSNAVKAQLAASKARERFSHLPTHPVSAQHV